jgi:hypothetical protein
MATVAVLPLNFTSTVLASMALMLQVLTTMASMVSSFLFIKS